ncbi:MAG: MFS transporter [Erysipelotrichales bacterium]|nr:MFS transporter [Erysipelotrichales bacterium]
MVKTKEKVGYAFGGIGHNLIYALFSGYLLIFYTDIFQLSGKFTAMLFLIARIFDAINDPIMGMIADKTNSKFGRYKVWLLRAAPVIAGSLILCFFVPNMDQKLQYIYVYVTYILLGMSFTAADIPYWTLPSVMTEDANERTSIFSIGSVAGSLASGIGAVAVPMIVSNAGSHAQGYLLAAIIFAVVGIIGYTVCAFTAKERIVTDREKVSFGEMIGLLVKNKPLLIIMAASLCGNMAFQIKIANNTYYGTYALGNYDYVTVLSGMLLVGMLAGTVIVPVLVKKFGSKVAMLSALGYGIVISVIYYLTGYQNRILVFIFSALSAITIGMFTVLVNAMTADTIDYAEWKYGTRAEGIITSTRTFITKLATAIAGSVAAYALDIIHYVPNVEQTDSVKQAFHSFMSIFPAGFYVLGFLILLTYPLTKNRFAEIQAELAERRNHE